MSFMFFLPNILLSGFMFPFAGMPRWAQVDRRAAAADALHPHRARHHAEGRRPSTTCSMEALALLGLMLLAMTLAVRRFRRTLD